MNFVLILFTLYLSVFRTEAGTLSPYFHIKNSTEDETQLTTINFDCQLLILERLDFMGLLNMAQTNKYFALLASDVFRRKFTRRTIIIEAKLSEEDADIVDDGDVSAAHGDVTIRNLEIASALLKLFGHSITKLKVLYERIHTPHATELMFNINKYCSETLIDLSLVRCTESLCIDFPKPFAKVENVSLSGFIKISNQTQLNETFPNLNQLSLQFIKILDPNCLKNQFPHLTEISIDFSLCEHMYPVAFQNLFEKNPQIRRIYIRYGSQSFLKIVNKYLPNLEILHIKRIIWNYFNSENWTDDAVKNEHLTDLYFTEDIFDYQFPKLAESFPNLEQVNVKGASGVEHATIIEFIEKLKKLKKLSLKTFNEKLQFSLKMELKNEWNVDCVYAKGEPMVITIESKKT